MIAAPALGALLAADARNVGRDPMLRWLVPLPLAVALLIRLGVAPLRDALQVRVGFDLEPYYVLVTSSLVLLIPGFVGALIGFLLLDLRDDRTLAALRVTPLTLRGFLLYRLAVPTVLGALLTVAVIAIAGLVPLDVPTVLLASVLAAPIAALYALFMATFATNKVEGFALMKAVGVVSIPPVVAWWIAEPWQWLAGLTPYYWAMKLYWIRTAGGEGVWLCMAVGLLYQGLLLWLLLRRTDRLLLE